MMKMKTTMSSPFLFLFFRLPKFSDSVWVADGHFFSSLDFFFPSALSVWSDSDFPLHFQKFWGGEFFQPRKSSSGSSSRVTPAEHTTPGPICQEKAAAKLKIFLGKKKKKNIHPLLLYHIFSFLSSFLINFENNFFVSKSENSLDQTQIL